MKYSYNWLKELVDLRNFTPPKLAGALEAQSFEVESVGRVKNLGVSDWVLNIETGKTNRVEALGHWGMAREISAVTSRPMIFSLDRNIPKPDNSALALKINPRLCRKYAGWLFENVKIGSSPTWLKARLLALGLKPISNVVDVANYVMLLTGQPLHVFDSAKLRGNMIQIRVAKNKEKIKTLDGETLELSTSDIVVADRDRAVAIAGVKGGWETGVSKTTSRIVLEAANFDPVKIRRTSWRVGLRTDAAHRFEKNLPLEFVEGALQEANRLLVQLAGATPGALALKTLGAKKPATVKLSLRYLNELLGYVIPRRRVENILKRLGFPFRKSGGAYVILVPFHRPDIKITEDIVEEISRLDGYANIPEQKPPSLAVSRANPSLAARDRMRQLLGGSGFFEVYNYSFYSQLTARQHGLPVNRHLALLNPLSQDQELMRISLLPNLLGTIEYNLRFSNELAVFEFGNVYEQKATAETFHDRARLGLCYARLGRPKEIFLNFKGRLETFLQALHIAYSFYEEKRKTGPVLKILNEKRRLLGEISLGKVDKAPAVAVELDFQELLAAMPKTLQFREFSRMPAKTLDLAIIVSLDTPWADVEKIVRLDPLVEAVNLFDVYQGGQIANGKKSLAFEIKFRDMKRTLSDQDVNKRLLQITNQLKTKLGAKLR